MTAASTVLAASVAIDPAVADTSEAGRVEDRIPSDADRHDAPELRGSTWQDSDAPSIQPFVLKNIQITGCTVFDEAQIRELLAPYVGKTVGASDLLLISKAVTNLYRDKGYFLSRAVILQQEIRNGSLSVNAIEGYVSDVHIEGLKRKDALAQFSRTTGAHPARLQDFERELLLLSDRPGWRVNSSQLIADPSHPERFQLNLKVSLKPVALRLYTDNRGTEANGPVQALAATSWNSLFADDDRLTATAFATPADTKELFFGNLNYAKSWLGGDLKTEVETSLSRTQDGTAPFDSRYTSQSQRVSVKLSTPLLRSRNRSIWLSAMLDGRDSSSEVPAETPSAERTRTLRGSINFTESDAKSRTELTLEESSGLQGIGASRNGDQHLSQGDARPQFSKIRVNASRLQTIWSNIDLLASATGQIADGALPSSEEFTLGGAKFGRAYDYGSASGDTGWAASVEMRFTTDVDCLWVENMQVYSFADYGKLWNLGSNPSGFATSELYSAGVGARIFFASGLLGTIEWATPLSNDVAVQHQHDARFFFTLSWSL